MSEEQKQLKKTLRLRTAELKSAQCELKKESARRLAAEDRLEQCKQKSDVLSKELNVTRKQLRRVTHHVLLVQEEERKKMSRELHDNVSQVLTGIDLYLANLAHKTIADAQVLEKEITRIQKLAEESATNIHDFARELRPSILDNIGLIVALRSYTKEFADKTKIKIDFSAVAETDELDDLKRTVIYRVAQSALININQHADASKVKFKIQKIADSICMEIHDNGKSFNVKQILYDNRYKRLGLLCMKERVEMVHGIFNIDSSPGKGTSISAQIPFKKNGKKEKLKNRQVDIL